MTVQPNASRPLPPSLSAATPGAKAVSAQGERTAVTHRLSDRLTPSHHTLELWTPTPAELLGQTVLPPLRQSHFSVLAPNTSAYFRAQSRTLYLCQGVCPRTEARWHPTSQRFRQGTPSDTCQRAPPSDRVVSPCSQTQRRGTRSSQGLILILKH